MSSLENLAHSVPTIQGPRIKLRPFSVEDLPIRAEWLSDKETYHLITARTPEPEELDMNVWYECLMDNPFTAVLAIEDETGSYIGDVEIHVENVRRRALGLNILIGRSEQRGKGYGTETMQCLLEYAFDNLRAFVLYINVFEFNGRAIRCYEKCGFEIVDRTEIALEDETKSYWLTMSCTPGTFQKAKELCLSPS
ncbi:MAG: GNAT family N-acetyltransferase [Planctomycetota bacterium]|nr:GNAT family N-acetyltransferase [Planctomycetota bacterium]MDA1143291.1 GNAT family N-acetyltransferase [Planctomycetota bacterium]